LELGTNIAFRTPFSPPIDAPAARLHYAQRGASHWSDALCSAIDRPMNKTDRRLIAK